MVDEIATFALAFMVFTASSFILPQWVFGTEIKPHEYRKKRLLKDSVNLYGIATALFFGQVVIEFAQIPPNGTPPSYPLFDVGIAFAGVGTIRLFQLVRAFVSYKESKRSFVGRWFVYIFFAGGSAILASIWLYLFRTRGNLPPTETIIVLIVSMVWYLGFFIVGFGWNRLFGLPADGPLPPVVDNQHELAEAIRKLAKAIEKNRADDSDGD